MSIQFKQLFPPNKNLAQMLEKEYKNFISGIHSNIGKYKDKTIDDVKLAMSSHFGRLELVPQLDFDTIYEPEIITIKEENPHSRGGFDIFEYRHYRFRFRGNSQMFFIESGGSYPLTEPPMGYIKDDYLYIKIGYRQDIENRNDEIFNKLKLEKDTVLKCLKNQYRNIREFVTQHNVLIEDEFKTLIIRKVVDKEKEKSLKEKLKDL